MESRRRAAVAERLESRRREAGCTEMTTRERQWEKSSIGENNGPELLELYLHPKRE